MLFYYLQWPARLITVVGLRLFWLFIAFVLWVTFHWLKEDDRK